MAEKKGLWAHIEMQAVPQKTEGRFLLGGWSSPGTNCQSTCGVFFYGEAALTDSALGQQVSWALSNVGCQSGDAVVVGS